MTYFYLALAIVSEVIATTALKSTHGFTRIVPTIVMAVGYATAFYFLTRVLNSMPVGTAYAIWSGVGIVLIMLAGLVIHGQKLDLPAVIGTLMIVAGVVTIHTLSKSVPM